jgi:Na+/proline symporter
MLGGLRGVLITDFVQFVIAMAGSSPPRTSR